MVEVECRAGRVGTERYGIILPNTAPGSNCDRTTRLRLRPRCGTEDLRSYNLWVQRRGVLWSTAVHRKGLSASPILFSGQCKDYRERVDKAFFEMVRLCLGQRRLFVVI